MEEQNQPPPLQKHQQPPPGLPSQLLVHPDNSNAPYAPSQDERTIAMLIHLLGLLTGFLGPLILWLVKKDQSRFIDHHGKEAVNFMLTAFLISIPLLVITIVTLGLGFFIYLPVMLIFFIFDILACVEANKGSWHRIPFNIRFIR